MSTQDLFTFVRLNERRFSVKSAICARASAVLFCSFAILLTTLCSTGCQTTKKVDLPKVVAEDATTGELCSAINANSAKIKSIYAPYASIGVLNQPGWAKCQLFFDRPNRLRVVGTATLMGRVVDSGCDGDQFWFWSSFQNADELYYCKLDQYKGSSLAKLVPIDPTWFPEALGIVEIKEDDVEGRTTADGEILLTVKRQTTDGVYRKRVYIEPRTAAIQRQDVQDPQGETILSVIVREQQYVETPGVVMPKRIEIRCEAAGSASGGLDLSTPTLLVDVGTPTLNDSSKMEASVFQRPTDVKATAVDLGAAAKNSQANAVSPTNFQPVRNAGTNPPAPPADVEKIASTQPTLEPSVRPASSVAPRDASGNVAANNPSNPGIVSFPSSVASAPPPPLGSPAASAPVVIQPTQTGGAAVYATVPAGGPQTMPTSDSVFAQRIMNAQELQNAQSAITGVPASQNMSATNYSGVQSAPTNYPQTANVPTTGFATQTPTSTPSSVVSSVGATPSTAASFQQSAPTANQPNVVQSPSAVQAPGVASFPAELGGAPTVPENPVEDDFPELLPF